MRLGYAITLLVVAFFPSSVTAWFDAHPMQQRDPAFDAIWARTDYPVAAGLASRTWIWGPAASFEESSEPYEDAPSGYRTVLYMDKARMEITDPAGDPSSIWYVTNGLLVMEMVSGHFQIGDDNFDESPAPAPVNVAGDVDDPNGPTYATIASIMDLPARTIGTSITQRVDRAGRIWDDQSLAVHGVSAAERLSVPGIDHSIASPFWEFMNSTGPVWVNEGGQARIVEDKLFPNPYYATGYPITEAYWANVVIGGSQRDVLLQCFERRCLTYTPDNPDGWKVELGNVGVHYRLWRYGL